MDYLTASAIKDFAAYLKEEEKSEATIEKYIRDAKAFSRYILSRPLTKEEALAYKENLAEKGYAASSINSMIAALNGFFVFIGREDLRLKPLKAQQKAYIPEERELTKAEYLRLVEAAERKGDKRLSLIIQTICATGIRVSELKYITVEAAREGCAEVTLKGKTRCVFIVKSLKKKLLAYAAKKNIKNGTIFLTRRAKPLDRVSIWREMKALCKDARVNEKKVFPHNLRHLFARVFYGMDKDIAKLADILGHSQINTTRIYIMSSGEEHRRKMENMRLII